MFEDAEPELERILKLVATCPSSLQEKCFEILLTAYTNKGHAARQMKDESRETVEPHETERDERETGRAAKASDNIEVPHEIRARFNSVAKRMNVLPTDFAKLFDFSSDPFTYHALQVPGDSKSVKTRNVALLVAAKNYLVTGHWTGDWKEFRAMCVDQNCYDRKNNTAFLRHDNFKTSSPELGVLLSGVGQKAAESLLATLAQSVD